MMSERYEVYAEMVETLRQAQGTVRQELDALAQAPEGDRATLVRLLDAVTSFDNQAHALALMVSDRDMPGDLLRIAEELGDFFEDARKRVETMLEADRG